MRVALSHITYAKTCLYFFLKDHRGNEGPHLNNLPLTPAKPGMECAKRQLKFRAKPPEIQSKEVRSEEHKHQQLIQERTRHHDTHTHIATSQTLRPPKRGQVAYH